MPAIVGAQVGRRAHAGQQHREAAPAELGEDGVQIARGLLRRQPAQHVVGTQLDDDQVGRAGQAAQPPAQPREALARRVARHASVADRRGHPRPAQRRLELDGEALSGRQAVPFRQAVAERPDQRAIGSGTGRPGEQRGMDKRHRSPVSPDP